MKSQQVLTAVAAILGALSCAGGPPPGIGAPLFTGAASDPAGDAIIDPRVPRPPDLTGASVRIGEYNAEFRIWFDKGTYRRGETDITVQIDSDLQPGSGRRAGPNFSFDQTIGVGGQFHRGGYVVSRPRPGQCGLGSCFEQLASGPIWIHGDTVTFIVPRKALLPSAGPLNFRVITYVKPASSQFSITLDHLPGQTDPAVRVR